MAWLSGWSYRKAVTIDSSLIDADLTDFPVVVKLTSSNFDFSKALSTGYDIRVTSDDGTTLLKYERERHDSTNSLAEYWVKIPSVLSASDTTFYIYYGNPDAADGADPTNVWDANFKGIWHLNQDPSGAAPQELDSTANNNDGTSEGSMTSDDLVEGQVDGALDFDGSDDYIDCGSNIGNFGTDSATIELWINQSGQAARAISKEKDDVNITDGEWAVRVEDGKAYFESHVGGTAYTSDLATVSNNVFYHLVVIWDRTNEVLDLYLNGALDNEKSLSGISGTLGNTDTDLYIGGRQVSGSLTPFEGILDESRISNVARSAAYIKASYNSENDSLLTLGAEGTVATLADTLNLSEVLQPLAGYKASLSDSLNLSESSTQKAAYKASLADSLNFSETISPIGHFSRAFSDTLNLTDVFRAFFIAYLSDTLSLTDSISAKAAHLANISDTLSLSDAISALGKFKVTLNDTLDITDALKAGLAGKLSDTLILSDAVSVLAGYIAKISDTLNFTDETFSIIVAKGKLTITFSSSKSTITFTPSKSTITFTPSKPTITLS